MSRRGDGPPGRPGGDQVTNREAEILHAVAERLRNREIAERLHISVRTVESHIAALLRKLAVDDRAGLIRAGTELARAATEVALPVPLTSFVGRRREQGEVAALVDTRRLVTLTGPAGVGKTRLALAVAAARAEQFPDGARPADLAPVTAELVADTLARTLGAIPGAGQPVRDRLCQAARHARCLLVVDNCEHVVTAAAAAIDDLLAAGDGIRVLVTSREPLAVPGEVSYPVPPLPVPTPRAAARAATAGNFDAVRLFVDRAAAAVPGFALTDQDAATVAALCQRLDGLPLAIELAASRVRTFPPAALVAHLDQRFDLLAGGSRTALPRHQTLRNALDWSYQLLDPDEQALFASLGVFPADFDYPAVQAVSADRSAAMRLLPALVDKSLVSSIDSGGGRRYRLLESLREYATQRLTDHQLAGARTRHAEHYLALAERAADHLRGPDQAVWLRRLDQEHDQLRAALAWSLAHRPDWGLRLATAVWWFWQLRGHFGEGSGWLERLLAAAPDAPPGVRAVVWRAAGVLAHGQGSYPTAATAFGHCLSLYRELGDRLGIAQALNGQAMVAWEQGDYREARARWTQCLSSFRQQDDQRGIAVALNNLGLVAREQGDYSDAVELLQECLAHYRALGDEQGMASALANLGQVSAERDDYARAAEQYAEALTLRRDLGHRHGIAVVLAHQGWLAAVRGDYDEADRLLAESRQVADEAGDRQRVAYARCGQAEVAHLRGDSDRAVARYLDVIASFHQLGERLGLATASLGLALAAASVGDATQAASSARDSQRLYRHLGHRKGLAWSQAALARAARLAGEADRAAGLDRDALATFQALGSRRGAAYCLEGLAGHAATAGQAELAVVRWAAATALREAIGAPVPLVDRPARAAALTSLRATLGDAGFETAWRRGVGSDDPGGAQLR